MAGLKGLFEFLERPTGTAIVTLLLGGLLGQQITATIQDGTRERDRVSALLKQQTEQGIAMHRRYAEDGLALLTRTYDRIGSVIASVDNTVLIARDPAFDPRSYRNAYDQARIRDQRRELRRKYATETDAWTREHESIGLQLDYYFGSSTDSIAIAWSEFDAAMDDFTRCVYRLYTRGAAGTPDDPDCAQSRVRVTRCLRKLSATLRESRVYLWQGWERELDPARIPTPRPWWVLWTRGTS